MQKQKEQGLPSASGVAAAANFCQAEEGWPQIEIFVLILFPWCSEQDNLLEPAAWGKGQLLNPTKCGPIMILTPSTIKVKAWSDPPGSLK